MSFTDIFIRRPVLSSVVSLLILLIGLSAAFNLPVRQYPELSNTTITITTTYPGANADVIKGFITVPIQQAVASAEGIDTLTSSSRQNVSTVTLNLRLNADPGRAVTDVLAKVNQVRTVLPPEAQDPIVVKQTGESTALMYLSFNSDVLTASQITDYLTRVVQPKLQTIDGVANAQILGAQTFGRRSWLDPEKMAALGITPTQVRTALAAHPLPLAPCHCDPLCENFLDTGDKMWIVDWEYSGMNDPMWDLGDLSVEGAFDADMDRRLMDAYFGGPATPVDLGRMVIYKAMCDLLWTLWGLIQHANKNPAEDFWAYSINRFERCKALMAKPDFARHVETVRKG